MGGRERIAGIPAHGGEDYVCRPAVAGEGRRGVSRAVAAARVATVPLATTLVITVSLRGKPLAEGAMHHGDRVYHERQLISQTQKEDYTGCFWSEASLLSLFECGTPRDRRL